MGSKSSKSKSPPAPRETAVNKKDINMGEFFGGPGGGKKNTSKKFDPDPEASEMAFDPVATQDAAPRVESVRLPGMENAQSGAKKKVDNMLVGSLAEFVSTPTSAANKHKSRGGMNPVNKSTASSTAEDEEPPPTPATPTPAAFQPSREAFQSIKLKETPKLAGLQATLAELKEKKPEDSKTPTPVTSLAIRTEPLAASMPTGIRKAIEEAKEKNRLAALERAAKGGAMGNSPLSAHKSLPAGSPMSGMKPIPGKPNVVATAPIVGASKKTPDVLLQPSSHAPPPPSIPPTPTSAAATTTTTTPPITPSPVIANIPPTIPTTTLPPPSAAPVPNVPPPAYGAVPRTRDPAAIVAISRKRKEIEDASAEITDLLRQTKGKALDDPLWKSLERWEVREKTLKDDLRELEAKYPEGPAPMDMGGGGNNRAGSPMNVDSGGQGGAGGGARPFSMKIPGLEKALQDRNAAAAAAAGGGGATNSASTPPVSTGNTTPEVLSPLPSIPVSSPPPLPPRTSKLGLSGQPSVPSPTAAAAVAPAVVTPAPVAAAPPSSTPPAVVSPPPKTETINAVEKKSPPQDTATPPAATKPVVATTTPPSSTSNIKTADVNKETRSVIAPWVDMPGPETARPSSTPAANKEATIAMDSFFDHEKKDSDAKKKLNAKKSTHKMNGGRETSGAGSDADDEVFDNPLLAKVGGDGDDNASVSSGSGGNPSVKKKTGWFGSGGVAEEKPVASPMTTAAGAAATSKTAPPARKEAVKSVKESQLKKGGGVVIVEFGDVFAKKGDKKDDGGLPDDDEYNNAAEFSFG